MAKGRKLMTSQSERFLGGYSSSQGQGTVADVSELGEEDVWAVVGDMVNEDGRSHGEWSPRASVEREGRMAVRGIRRREDRNIGGLSLAFDERMDRQTTSSRIVHQFRSQEVSVGAASPRGRHMATSAPVNVPDWTTIYRFQSVESLPDSDDAGDDLDSEMVPPHEYLGRKMAANSVFEGVGRTLKGRDMSRVRDAVWSQTGFDG